MDSFEPYSILEIAKRHAGILILVVEEHDVGVDDINETSGINHVVGELSWEFFICKTDLSICQNVSDLYKLFLVFPKFCSRPWLLESMVSLIDAEISFFHNGNAVQISHRMLVGGLNLSYWTEIHVLTQVGWIDQIVNHRSFARTQNKVNNRTGCLCP